MARPHRNIDPANRPVWGGKIGNEISRALGLDPTLVRNIDIECHIDNAVLAKVEMFVSKRQAYQIIKIMHAYQWQEEKLSGVPEEPWEETR